jgi:pimeloyl-ACP methyl ester carboxylesterase
MIIQNVLDTFGLSKDLTFVGHSLGGYISGLFSIKYPERVKK